MSSTGALRAWAVLTKTIKERWAMYTDAQLHEYLDEIRKQVCTRCIDRPPGGPPCAPLGKMCAVELFLPTFLRAVHEVDSPVRGSNGQRRL